MVWLTGAIALFAGVSVLVGGLQWSAIKGQLAEMQKGGTDTHELAVAAVKQADAARATADSTKDIAERALSQAKATNELAGETRRFAIASEPKPKVFSDCHQYNDAD